MPIALAVLLAMKSADIEWNDKTLDQWIEDLQHLVPGNEMTFAGIKDARQRTDLLAFLKEATQPGASGQQGGPMGGMGGMGGRHAPACSFNRFVCFSAGLFREISRQT